MATSVHQLKVTVRDVDPPVWRRIALRSDVSLGEMAAVLEGAMGWAGYHLHQLQVGDVRYGMRDPDSEAHELDENQFQIASVLSEIGMEMAWIYDFGDGWEHDVVVEAIGPPEPGVEYPVCLDGQRACPAEDCGGPGGYAYLLEVVENPQHPEYAELSDWLSPDFDPEHFDADAATDAMRSPRPFG